MPETRFNEIAMKSQFDPIAVLRPRFSERRQSGQTFNSREKNER